MWTSYDRWFCREQKVHLSRAWYVLHPELSTSGRAGHTVIGMEKYLDAKNITRRINLQEDAAKRSMTASTTDSSATKPSERRWLKWDALKRSSKKWISLQVKTHTYKATRAEIDVYRGNWWIHSNVANFDSVPTRHQPDFKKALSTMYRLKKAEDEKQYAKWSQSSTSSSWQWQTNWWESDYEYSPQRWYDHWLNGATRYFVANYSSAVWVLSKNWLKNFYREYVGNSWRQSTVTDGWCKYNTSCTWNSRTYLWYNRLRNIVHNLKHTFTYIETTVTNCVNTMTHTDVTTAHHWARCAPFVDESSNLFTPSHWLKASQCLSISSMVIVMRTCSWVLFSSSCPFTSCPSSSSTSSWFLPWCLTRIPWKIPCATPLSGAWSAWTMSHPTQNLRVLHQLCDQFPILGTYRHPRAP